MNTNTGNGLGAQGDAANFALTAGLLRPSELASGVINHPLIMTVPCTNANGAGVGYSYPATGGWGEACGDYWNESGSGAPELGQLLRLNLTDQQIANSPAPTWQKTIMTALSHYGAYIEDTDGSWNSGVNVITQDSESWTDLGQPDQWAALAKQYGNTDGMLSSDVPISASDFQVVDSCVARGTCPASIQAPVTTPVPPVTSPAASYDAGSAGDDAGSARHPADPGGRAGSPQAPPEAHRLGVVVPPQPGWGRSFAARMIAAQLFTSRVLRPCRLPTAAPLGRPYARERALLRIVASA